MFIKGVFPYTINSDAKTSVLELVKSKIVSLLSSGDIVNLLNPSSLSSLTEWLLKILKV